MGGGFNDYDPIGPQTYEEAKCSNDHIVICRLHRLFTEQTLYTCFAIGLFVYIILMYVFLQREHAHITSNPEIQWHLKQIKEEEKEFEDEVKVRYLAEQRKRRVKRRAYMKEYKQEKLKDMDPEDRDKKVERERKRKDDRVLHEQMLYQQVCAHQARELTNEEDRYLRQLIKKDVKELTKFQKYQDNDFTESDEDQRLEDKVQYGSDSESDIQSVDQEKAQWEPKEMPEFETEEEMNKYYEEMMAKYGVEDDEDEGSYYEEEKYNEEDNHIQIPDDDELEFDQDVDDSTHKGGNDRVGRLVDTSNSSAGSQDVIEDSIESTSYDQSNEETKLQLPETSSASGTTLEMTDLKVKGKGLGVGMREFVKPSSSANQSQKKREKRKLKKAEEEKAAALEGIRKLSKEAARQKDIYFKKLEKGIRTDDVQYSESGKVIRKKVVPKKIVKDEKGDDWEVVDTKKTQIVEEDQSSDINSDSSD